MSRLTRTMFAEGMALLAERWNRELSPSMSRIYAGALRDLGAELFAVGITRAIEEEEFFPSPRKIRELARPAAAASARAGEVLTMILDTGWHTPNGRAYSLEAIEGKVGEAAMRAVASIGGPQRLSTLTVDAFPFVLRDFTAAFAEFDAEVASRAIVADRLEAYRAAPMLAQGAERRRIGGGKPVAVADVIAAAIPAGTFTEDP